MIDATQLSDLLFGRSCRLPLAIWIMRREKDRFFQSEPPRQIAVTTAVRQELGRFVQLGLLNEERPDGDNRVYYVRTESPLWDIIRVAEALVHV